jgi:hypothetical protein
LTYLPNKAESLKMMGIRAVTVSAKENTGVRNVSGMIENI